jgi:hypothetical protein
MTLDELHHILTTKFELVPDTRERGNGRTYFWKQVIWAPSESTRIIRIHFDATGTVNRMQLCVSSDNNNSVFVHTPFDMNGLHVAISDEIRHFHKRTETI